MVGKVRIKAVPCSETYGTNLLASFDCPCIGLLNLLQLSN